MRLRLCSLLAGRLESRTIACSRVSVSICRMQPSFRVDIPSGPVGMHILSACFMALTLRRLWTGSCTFPYPHMKPGHRGSGVRIVKSRPIKDSLGVLDANGRQTVSIRYQVIIERAICVS